ncbi:MAG: DNA topoisomerase I [Proteobacteria bacterium HN_bin10]|nr:MAG: DNA topoisomerase I [Proteobacteria bacterium HN_bin10]
MNVVVVESPAKAKTINKYLGSDYKVLASYGHIRDLPAKDGSVKPDDDFAMSWEVDPKSSKHVKAIADALKDANNLILATDPDREGEAISWHVLEALNQKKALKGKSVKRVTFNAITKPAVQAAMAAPRDIDMELVDAYLARRALDYLVGFTLSPVLWRKLPGSRSAGRVQSVALRIIVDREVEIERFRPQEYWSVDATLATPRNESFTARLSAFQGKKLKRLDIENQAMAFAARDAVKNGRFTVSAVEAKPTKRNPPPPFTTSTLQQEAARKLGFNASRTMQTAQRLYEAGHITYMRTDGVSMDEGAIRELRTAIGGQFGKDYVPAEPRRYTSKVKNAQEAHEAIRPTDPSRQPRELHLDGDQARLYELIWKRAVASQMEAASIERTSVDFTEPTGKVELRATGQVILFDGFLKLYQEGRDDEEDEENRRLPQLRQGEAVTVQEVKADQHFTEPPPRYSEASLVKKLEELGIGRPSTYAAILEKLRERNYVRMDKNRFVPDDRGRLVIAFLENFFGKYVEYDFTADLEEKLDEVSAGELNWKTLMRDFWKDFNGAIAEIGELRITQVLDTLNEVLGPHIFPPKEDGSDPRTCPLCGVGQLSLRLGKYGAFVGCSNYNGEAPCKYTRPLAGNGDEAEQAIPSEGLLVGDGPNGPILLKSGRFGAYFETPNPSDPDKPKRASVPKGQAPTDVSLETAIKLLSLPREVGMHPSENEMIVANIGRYGPYIKMGNLYVNLPGADDVHEIQMNRAVALIEEKKAGGAKGRFGRAAPAPIKELGESPVTGKPVRVLNGRYGPYISDGETNANVPKDKKPEDVTADEALSLLAARAEAGGGKKKAKRAPPKKAAAEKKEASPKKATTQKPAKKSAKA